MKFSIDKLNIIKILNSQLELKYGKVLIRRYPYLIFLKNNYLFDLELLSKLFPNEIVNPYNKISLNNIESYISCDYKSNTNVFLHTIDFNTSEKLKKQLITTKVSFTEDENNIDISDISDVNDPNQYKILDLIEDSNYILTRDALKKYNIYICYLNGKYILLSSTNKLHNYFSELEAKNLLNEL